MRNRISSRLVKKEKTKVVRQFWLFIILAVILIGLFIFVILPNFINITSSLLGSNNAPFAPKDELPPFTPTLTAPPKATKDAELLLFGYAEAESEVFVIVNGEELEAVKAQADGSFQATTVLTEGENVLTTYARDAAGNESQVSRAYKISLDTEVPLLDVTQPTADATIQGRAQQNLSVTGVTDPGVKVTINGQLTYAKQDGVFTHNFRLQEGKNELELIATDAAGNVTEKKIAVTFQL
ncbi:MAG: Ig-like domain-containing protein [bacterium]|nr:Ig-like domain-containing protein [bacterium]